MNINQKLCSILTIIFAIITLALSLLHFSNFLNGNIDVMMIFLGLTTLFGGLGQINLSQQIDSNGIAKGSKIAGILSLIVGLIIIISVSFTMIA